MPILTGTKTGAKYKRYVLVDQGNDVLAIAFKEAIRPVSSALKLFKVFKISNADLQPTSTEFEAIGNAKYQWVLERSTMIRPMPLENPNLSTIAQDIVPFNMIADRLPKPGDAKPKIVSIDIMGVVIRDDNPKDASSPYGPSTVQRFMFVDMERKPIPVSLWDELVTTVGPILEEAEAAGPRIQGHRTVVPEDIFV